jgi:hypothetical protein
VIKATAGLAGAGLALWTWRHRGLRRAVVLGAAVVATVAVAYALAGGTAALGPLDHAAGQVSQGSVWSEPARLGLPAVPTMVMTLMTGAIVAIGIWRRTRDDPAEAGIAGPAAFLLAAPYVLPGYLGWVLPGAAIHPARRTSRIVALQATLLVVAYAVFHHQLQGVVGDAIVATTGLVTPLLGVALLVAYLRTPRFIDARSEYADLRAAE